MTDKFQQAQWKLEGRCHECGKGLEEHHPTECDVAYKDFLGRFREEALRQASSERVIPVDKDILSSLGLDA